HATLEALSRTMGVPVAVLERKNEELHEFNPMLGHRGCRLAITFPEIYEMQARAILEAACDVAAAGALVELARERGRAARPGIKLGVCGEHGGDPASILFFGKAGLDYVS